MQLQLRRWSAPDRSFRYPGHNQFARGRRQFQGTAIDHELRRERDSRRGDLDRKRQRQRFQLHRRGRHQSQRQLHGCAGGGSPTTKGTANGAFVGAAAERMITSFGLTKGTQAIARRGLFVPAGSVKGRIPRSGNECSTGSFGGFASWKPAGSQPHSIVDDQDTNAGAACRISSARSWTRRQLAGTYCEEAMHLANENL